MGAKSKETIDHFLKRVREEIIPMFEMALSKGGVVFKNSRIVKCWEVMDCKATGCTLYGYESGEVRCWQIAGTYCGGEPQGSFVQKYGTCSNCKVFKESCPSIVEEIGEQFNNMMFLLKKQGQKMQEDDQHMEHLNRELRAALEQLDVKNKEIRQIMITDKLTSLFNRDHLVTVLEDEVARCHRYGHPLAILIIDIDRFKSFNDNYGHLAGDQMLAVIGTLIKENIRKFDRAFRYSGGKFVVILPETDLTLAYIVAERIRKSFENKTFPVHKIGSASEKQKSRTLSIGITATFPYKTNNLRIEDLFDQMEKALHQAKGKGGNISIRFE
ncbi:MAG: GGDEF domain-containing protein [Nitrospirae bacterium]|nr:GGDEF domain-containing protein [Nitrospirota bacterium]